MYFILSFKAEAFCRSTETRFNFSFEIILEHWKFAYQRMNEFM